ncbi:transcription elongation factor SPT4-like [Bolinopsis microptera]|uniref:transcription elongation factor SPT4-like n=1 Tax=Bolinopsis microptera TaxID=2820187 RepID=UPI003079694D
MEVVPKDLNNIRACMMCSLLKNTEQFIIDGCDNCDQWLSLKNNRERVLECTSPNYEGMISLTNPDESWVARWQGIRGLVRGMYAISVMGKMPSHIQRELERQGRKYKSRDLGMK